MDDWLDLPKLIEDVQELFDLSLYDEGLDLLDQYNDIYNTEWEIHFLYSRAYSEQNKPQDAIPHLKQGLKFDKDNSDCLLGLFYAYTQMDQMQKGTRYLFKAKKLYPDNDLIINALIWYYSETNNFEKAIDCYESAKSFLDYNSEALRNTGIAYERMGNFDKALICFKMSLELNPDFDETRDLLADHYILRGEAAKSIGLYKNYLIKSVHNIRAMSRLVFCLSQNDQLQEAEDAAKEIISIYPNSPVGYVDLAYAFLNGNHTEEAIKIADKALDVSPIDAEALRVKGIAYSDLDNNPAAKECFEKALALSPDNPEIMRDYYHHLRNAELYKKMESMVQKVIKQEFPYCIEDYWFFADYYREKGENLKAFHYLNRAYRSMPGEKEIIPPMVEILLDMGHTSFAIPILKRYIETKGWDEIMKGFTRHKKLQGKWSQEGLRFLQFYGQKPVEFREFIFSVYVRKFIFISINAVLLAFLTISFLYFNIKGLLIFLSFYIVGVLSVKATTFFIEKKQKFRKSRLEQ